MSVNTADKPLSKELSRKLLTERKLVPVIIGIMMKDSVKDATKTMRVIMNMKATYALKDIAIPPLRIFV